MYALDYFQWGQFQTFCCCQNLFHRLVSDTPCWYVNYSRERRDEAGVIEDLEVR
ncbi:hypothetical protein BC629DRAFT_1556768 [Irpex lacteus]|nr:hypothetical protein BC629DRAFT_1556768 [Irpex lacteus]